MSTVTTQSRICDCCGKTLQSQNNSGLNGNGRFFFSYNKGDINGGYHHKKYFEDLCITCVVAIDNSLDKVLNKIEKKE